MNTHHIGRRLPASVGAALAAVLTAGLVTAGCQKTDGEAAAAGGATPVYNATTGRLEQLIADRNGDGKTDTRAFMDGVHFKSVEIDRNADGKPDRWEYYGSPDGSAATESVLVRAEEANGADGKVTRKEFYDHGRIQRVEEDTDADGRIDKWEWYEAGGLVRMELDLQGKGFPDRRMIYGPNGQLERIEADPDGDGKFKPWKAGGRW